MVQITGWWTMGWIGECVGGEATGFWDDGQRSRLGKKMWAGEIAWQRSLLGVVLRR